MSSDYALPSSTALERDAHLVSTDHKVAPSEIAMGVIIGRTSEFFDFFVFGIASVLVFPRVFFPFVDPLTGTLYSFALFALAFVARPIGSTIFMEIDRRHGRSVKLTIALFLLGSCTAAISFLPRYETIGMVAVWLLAAFRFGQGLALGGAWDGLASLLALNAPDNRRGWYAMLPQLGAPLGFMLASALFSFFIVNLDDADFVDWGWRYPFYVAFAINVVALFARLRLVVTDEFTELLNQNELTPVPVFALIRSHGRNLAIGALVPLASFALFHLVTIFPISWITLFTQRSAGEFLMVQFAGAIIGAGAMVSSGLIADQIGRRTMLAISAALITVFALGSILAPILFGDSAAAQTIYVVVGFGLLGLSYGQTAGAVSSNFGSRYRYTGSALTSDLAWLFGAGFAPLVALTLSSRYGLAWVGVYLLSGGVATLLALGINRSLSRDEGQARA
ncbi:MFS transporter [Methylobacterium organophilum]|uniref:Inner membrane metabolite transport protein YhjE n=1 Tax=Methylobacterium organophilum TaxID=410 RepID=A0ABQ4TDG8_METOR|nr:MFS transporter [Methylobacterium organophilum]UMY17340.1 MFS transporter [Methylobacterium organophilum]GJE29273.1 Inner membrane metabolite transport protein YhjE [Methylobacterium organophilum]